MGEAGGPQVEKRGADLGGQLMASTIKEADCPERWTHWRQEVFFEKTVPTNLL
jgi:hypothetical protein